MPRRPAASPLRVLEALLARVSSRHAAAALVGDLTEVLTRRATEGRPLRWPRLWINLRLGLAIVAALSAACPRLTRAAVAVVADAWRTIRRTPAHSGFVVAILALAIAVGTVTFSVVDAVLFKPLPLPDADRLVMIPGFELGNVQHRITPQTYWALRDRTQTLESVVVASNAMSIWVSVDGVGVDGACAYAPSEALRLFGMSAGLGRLWTPEEEVRAGSNVAVLSYSFWRNRLGGRRDVIGRPVTIDGRSYQVIGVFSKASDHPELPLFNATVWVPSSISRDDRTSFVSMTGKVRQGATREQVADELEATIAALGAPKWRPEVVPYLDNTVRYVRTWMLLAFATSGVVVLLGCVNAANLMLSRAHHRAREIALRASLGASRRRIAAGMVAEGVLLSLSATWAALLFGLWGINVVRATLLSLAIGARAAAIALNGRVLVAALASAVVTGVLFSCVPAWQASRTSIVSLLKDGGQTLTGGRSRWRNLFVITEVASVAILLVMSWLFVASLVRAMNIDLGVDRSHLINLSPRTPFRAPLATVQERLRQIPGVRDVAFGFTVPLFPGVESTDDVRAVGEDATVPVETMIYRVTPNVFSVAKIAFLTGDTWSVHDAAPAVLDLAAATTLFGGRNAIGRQVEFGKPARVFTIVGVVANVHGFGVPERNSPPALYVPLVRPDAQTFGDVLVSTWGGTGRMLPAIRDAMTPYAPNQADEYIHSGDQAMRSHTIQRWVNAAFMAVFGTVGVLIGAAGIYAVTASVVSQQTSEIGVRMVLGATPTVIARDVLGGAVRHLAIGLAVGLPIAWWSTRGLAAMLFGVTPADVSVYAGVAGVLAGVGLAAAMLPALRASRVDPIVSIRQ